MAPEIKDPILKHAPIRKSVACFGAVNLGTDKFVRAMFQGFNGETFEVFLKILLRHRSRGKRTILVLDDAKLAPRQTIGTFLREYRRALAQPFLPRTANSSRPSGA